MFLVFFELDNLLAELAGLRSEGAARLMSLNLFLVEFDLTVLTDDLSVRLSIMFIFLCLGHYITALFTLVVVPCAAHLVQTKFAQFDLLLARATLLARLIPCRYLVSLH